MKSEITAKKIKKLISHEEEFIKTAEKIEGISPLCVKRVFVIIEYRNDDVVKLDISQSDLSTLLNSKVELYKGHIDYLNELLRRVPKEGA